MAVVYFDGIDQHQHQHQPRQIKHKDCTNHSRNSVTKDSHLLDKVQNDKNKQKDLDKVKFKEIP